MINEGLPLSENAYPMMSFGHVGHPDYFDSGEMKRREPVHTGFGLLRPDLEEPISVLPEVVQLIASGELSPFQKIAIHEFIIFRKDIISVAQKISELTPERVHPEDVELALRCAFDKMKELQ